MQPSDRHFVRQPTTTTCPSALPCIEDIFFHNIFGNNNLVAYTVCEGTDGLSMDTGGKQKQLQFKQA